MTVELPVWLIAPLRTGIQSAWALLVAHFSFLAVIPQNTAVDWVVTVVVVGGITAALRWMETRTGDTWWERAARRASQLLMLGLSKAQPSYPQPAKPEPDVNDG